MFSFNLVDLHICHIYLHIRDIYVGLVRAISAASGTLSLFKGYFSISNGPPRLL